MNPSTHTPAASGPPLLPAQAQQYLSFMLAGETFALSILSVREIIEFRGLTTVPMMPACVRGVINLRGAVVPVMDLQARFGRAPSEIGRRTSVVIVEVGPADERQNIGVIVDAVNEVLDIPADAIEPPPAFGARIRADFILGMGKAHGRFVILLDARQVLSLEDVAALTSVPAALTAQ